MAVLIDKWQAVANLMDAGLKDTKKAVDAIQFMPEVDARTVITCGECENWQIGWKPSAAKEGQHFCAVTGLCKYADWFCADGEKREES